jgi:hypothetical protein
VRRVAWRVASEPDIVGRRLGRWIRNAPTKETCVRLATLLLGSSLAACAAVPSSGIPDQQGSAAEANPRSNRVSIYLGQRSLDEDDYQPVEDQGTIGVEFSQELPDSVIGWEVGLTGSGDGDEILGIDIAAATAELYGGVRKSFGSDSVRPYIGAGLSVISVAVDTDVSAEEDDGSLGLYAHGGVNFQISPLFSLGVDLRGLFGSDIHLSGVDTDADYVQFALVAGFAF